VMFISAKRLAKIEERLGALERGSRMNVYTPYGPACDPDGRYVTISNRQVLRKILAVLGLTPTYRGASVDVVPVEETEKKNG